MEVTKPLNWVVIDRDGNAFIAVDYLDLIPTSAPDKPIRDRVFTEPINADVPGPASLYLDSHLFVSLNQLNILLASAPTRPLHARIIAEVTGKGHHRISLRLEDSLGEVVAFDEPACDALEDLQELVPERNELGGNDAPWAFEDDCATRHDTAQEEDGPQDEQARRREVSDQGGGQEHQMTPASPIPTTADTINTPPRQERQKRGEAIEATPFLPENQQIAYPSPSPSSYTEPSTPRPYRQHVAAGGEAPDYHGLVKQLHDLQLTDNATLAALLRDRLPPALRSLRSAQDDLVHLATLTSGKVYFVRIFRDLHARREDLSFPSLADPALIAQSITEYKKIELLNILLCVSPSLGNESQEHHHSSTTNLSVMSRKLVDRSYHTIAQLDCDLDRLATTTTGSATVARIRAMMRARCAIGAWDVLDPLFHGLLREVVIQPAGEQRQQQQEDPMLPRFVLPLGRLYHADSTSVGAQTRPLDCFVLIDLATPRKALWLFQRNDLTSELVLLAADVRQWRLSSGSGDGSGGLLQGSGPGGSDETLSCRTRLVQEKPAFIAEEGVRVRFRRVDRRRAAEVIRQGWGVSTRLADIESPLRTALLNSVKAARAPQTPPRKSREKRPREEAEDQNVGEERPAGEGGDGSDDEWTPALERQSKARRPRRGGRRSAAIC